MQRLLMVLLLAFAAPLSAQMLEPLPPPPPLPEGVGEEEVEPEVTIRQDGENEIEEHRIHGRLYKVKVTPRHGVPYYLIDHNGDGVMVRHDILPDLSVPMWVIKTW